MIKSALHAALLCCLLGSLVCEDQKPLTVKCGENATLECHGPKDATDVLLRWSRPDLQSEGYVLYFKQNRFDNDLQHQLFKGRVALQDPKMKNGDFSVILKNVTMNDSGLYECYVGYNNQKPKPVSNINLRVEEPGPPGRQGGDGTEGDGGKDASVGLIVGVSVAVLFFAAVFCFVIDRRCRIRCTRLFLNNNSS